MKLISIIGNGSYQVLRATTEIGKKIDITLRYVSLQQGWFMSFTYGDFTANNIRVVTGGNIIHKFRNLVPFGFSCVTEIDQEPMLLEDFSSGRAKLYLLTQDEVTQYSEVISGQATA